MRSQEEIDAEIKALRDMKPNVRRTSAFGDNHHHAIEAQIEVLEGGMDEGDIYDKFEPSDDSDIDHDEGRGENVLDNALLAMSWMQGESQDAPSKEWQSLVQ